MAELMRVMSQRYHVMYHAAKANNWELATYQLRRVRKALSTAKVTRPKYGDAIERFILDFIEPLDKAVRGRDWLRFDSVAQASVAASDAYHDDWGYGYIRYRIPEAPPLGYDVQMPEKS